jgi:hypothetical protein
MTGRVRSEEERTGVLRDVMELHGAIVRHAAASARPTGRTGRRAPRSQRARRRVLLVGVEVAAEVVAPGR